jgi:signal peptide peptidase SppA
MKKEDIMGSLGGLLAQKASQGLPSKTGPVVSVIKLEGTIAAGGGGGMMGGGGRSLNLKGTREMIKEAFNRKGLTAVALSINSPGGSPVQSDLIGREIRYWAKKKNVPVFAFVEDVAASGGYWIACSADKIYGMPSSITGSIGVIGGGFGFDKLIAKLGVERRIYTSGKNKSKNDPFMPEKPGDLVAIKDLQSKIHEQFKDWVKSRRPNLKSGDPGQSAEDFLMNGDYWTSPDSLKYGIIDGIGELEQTMRDEYGDNVNIMYPTAEKMNVLSLLRGGGLSRAFAKAADGNGVGGEIVDRAFSQIDERTHWARFGLTPPRP